MDSEEIQRSRVIADTPAVDFGVAEAEGALGANFFLVLWPSIC